MPAGATIYWLGDRYPITRAWTRAVPGVRAAASVGQTAWITATDGTIRVNQNPTPDGITMITVSSEPPQPSIDLGPQFHTILTTLRNGRKVSIAVTYPSQPRYDAELRELLEAQLEPAPVPEDSAP